MHVSSIAVIHVLGVGAELTIYVTRNRILSLCRRQNLCDLAVLRLLRLNLDRPQYTSFLESTVFIRSGICYHSATSATGQKPPKELAQITCRMKHGVYTCKPPMHKNSELKTLQDAS